MGIYVFGLPKGYEEWAYSNLKELAKIPTY